MVDRDEKFFAARILDVLDLLSSFLSGFVCTSVDNDLKLNYCSDTSVKLYYQIKKEGTPVSQLKCYNDEKEEEIRIFFKLWLIDNFQGLWESSLKIKDCFLCYSGQK